MDQYSGTSLLKIDCRAVKDKVLFQIIIDISNAILHFEKPIKINDLEILIKHLATYYIEKVKTLKSIDLDNKIPFVKEYIDQNYTEKLIIDDLASKVGMKNIAFIGGMIHVLVYGTGKYSIRRFFGITKLPKEKW